MAKKNNDNNDIISYYDQTEFDYKVAWYGKDNPALHFGFYDKEEADSHYDALAYTNKILATNAKIKDGDKILDAGCGLGGSTMWLAQNYDVEAVGISLSERQIAACNERAKELGLKHKVDFIASDFTKTPFEDGTFDVVWACESVCHAFQKLDFYKEAYRILKPGGRIVVADYIRSARPLSEVDENLLKHKWLNNWAIDDLDTEEENYNHLKTSDFKEINIQNVNKMVGVSLRNLHEKCTRSYPIERVLKFFGIRSAVQHGNLVGSINQYKAFKKGIWWYCLISAEK